MSSAAQKLPKTPIHTLSIQNCSAMYGYELDVRNLSIMTTENNDVATMLNRIKFHNLPFSKLTLSGGTLQLPLPDNIYSVHLDISGHVLSNQNLLHLLASAENPNQDNKHFAEITALFSVGVNGQTREQIVSTLPYYIPVSYTHLTLPTKRIV